MIEVYDEEYDCVDLVYKNGKLKTHGPQWLEHARNRTEATIKLKGDIYTVKCGNIKFHGDAADIHNIYTLLNCFVLTQPNFCGEQIYYEIEP